MKVVAIDKFEYANKLRMPGDEFDTDNDKHAELLQLAQRVKIVPEMENRALQAESDVPKKKRYGRRDMRPED